MSDTTPAVDPPIEEKKESSKKDLMLDILYAGVKGISGFGLEAFTDLKI